MIAGCPGAVDPAAGRTTLADARQACDDVGANLAAFNPLVDLFRAFRDEGLLETDAFGAVIQQCEMDFPVGDPWFEGCLICFPEIVAAVYNE